MPESNTPPTIFICIPVFNRIRYTVKCLESIERQTYTRWQVIVCDDGSTDNTADVIRERFPYVIIERGTGSLYWTGGINRCVSRALSLASDGDFIYTLNNDTELYPDVFEQLLEKARKQPRSLIGTLNLFFEEPARIENSAFTFSKWRGFKRYRKFGERLAGEKGLAEVSGLAGKGVLVPVSVFHHIGLYNEKLLPHYHADLEFSFRAKKNGYRVFLDFDSRLLSHQGLSGLGSVTSAPSIRQFINSFRTLRSTHHLPSLVSFSKLIHGSLYLPHLVKDLIFINLGFIKRWSINKFKKDESN